MRSFIRFSLKLVGALFLVLLLLFALQLGAAESGEVVVIHVPESDGSESSIRVWVVEQDGTLWIRGTPSANGWSARALRAGGLRLERAGQSSEWVVRREQAREVIQRINARFNEKYGWRDDLISLMIGDADRSEAVVIELIPEVR